MSSSAPVIDGNVRQAQKVTAVQTTTARAGNSSKFGLLLLDSSLRPVYFNSEAISIVAYPKEPAWAKLSGREFHDLIRQITQITSKGDDGSTITLFASGRRHYVCRWFMLEAQSEGSKPTMAVTIERHRWLIRDLVVRYQLTDREVQAVQHLAEGLTSKEIAHRMSISPNTVKTFLRFVMIKMGVTTRSGVIGKLVHEFGET